MKHSLVLAILIALTTGCASPPVQSPTASPSPTSLPPPSTTAEPTRAASATPEPTPTPAASETASPAPGPAILNFPIAGCCQGRVISAGLYRLPAWLELPLTIEVTEGWRVMNEQSALLFTLARGENELGNPSELIVFIDASTTGKALLAQFAGEPAITALGDPAPAELAGFAGQQQDFAVLANPDYAGNPQDDIPPGVQFIDVVEQFFAPGFIWTTSTPEAQLRFITVDIGDALLFVYLESTPTGFETFVADAGEMLETLAIEAP